jgi:ElaB/YqjD/DUF883 family membrane-anchored ribosome-binding protein
MNSETSSNGTVSMTGTPSASLNGDGKIQRAAQKAHEAVDYVAQNVSTGSDRVMSMQEEYGAYAREQIRANPLAVVGGAFVLGLLLGKVMR